MAVINALSTAALLAARGDGDGAWWIFGPLMLLFWLGVIVLVAWFFTRRFRPYQRTAADRARDILAERYARGEITSEEYRERHDQLE